MKKISMILVFIMILALGAGCGENAVTDVTTQNQAAPVSYVINSLINNGSQNLDQSAAAYTNLDATTAANVKSVADYMLFPFNLDGSKDFSGRMKDIYHDEDNIIKAYSLVMQASATNGGSPSIMRKVSGTRIFDPVTASAVVSVFSSVASFIMSGPSNADLQRQLNKMNVTIHKMHADLRIGFAGLNRKTDQIISSLASLKGDINILNQGQADIEQLIINNGMNDVMLNFNGFLDNYELSATTDASSNATYNYIVSSSDFAQDTLKFITCSTQIQGWAVANSQYSTKIWNDPAVTTNYAKVELMSADNQNMTDRAFEYNNPKRGLNMSLGNLEYLAKIFISRLTLNSVLYSGETLKANNQAIAQYCLDKLEELGLRQKAIGLINAMNSQLNTYLMLVDIDFLPWNSVGTFIYSIRKNGQTIALYPYTHTKEQVKEVLRNEHNKALMEYLGIFAAKLISLEVQLKSYL